MKKCQTFIFQRLFSEFDYFCYFLSYVVIKCCKRDESYCRNVFRSLFRSLFLEYKFKRFLQEQVVKWFFPRLKEQHLIGKLRFCPGFCWKFDSGKLFTLIYLAILNEKPKNHIPQCQSQLSLSNGTLFALLFAS